MAERGPDDDHLRGGLGSDDSVIEANHGHDVIEDRGGTHDWLTFAGLSADQVMSVRDEDDLRLDFPGGSVRIVDPFGEGPSS